MKKFINFLIAIGLLGVVAAQMIPDDNTIRADVLVKVGNSIGFEDGDIIHAFSESRNLNVYAQHITNPKSSDGLRVPGTLLQDYLEATKQYKFERISEKEILRTDLFTGSGDTFSDVPNADGEYIDVPLYIERRLRSERHKIFGTKGSEFWYGGRTRITKQTMNNVWDKIEQKSSFRKRDHTEFPFTDNELSKYYVIKVSDYTQEEINEMSMPLLSSTGALLKGRKYKVDYRNLPSISIEKLENINNRSVKVDDRRSDVIRKGTLQDFILEKLSFLIQRAYAAAVTDTIGTTSRDFSTITLWEDSLGAHSGDDMTAEMYNDSAFDETVNIDDTTPLTILLTVPVAERHDGTEGNGTRIVRTGANIVIDMAADETTIEWLEIDINGQNATALLLDLNSDLFVKNMILHGSTGDGNITGVIRDQAKGTIMNSIIYDYTNTHTGTRGVSGILDGSTRDSNYFNNTIHGITNNNGTGVAYGINLQDDAGSTFQNNIATDAGGTTSGTKQDYNLSSISNATVDHNLSSDSTASGVGSLSGATAADFFVSTTGGSEDFHLKTGASIDPIDAGVDKGTTPTGVNFDIDNFDRNADAGTVWDMGADEFVAAAAAAAAPSEGGSTWWFWLPDHMRLLLRG